MTDRRAHVDVAGMSCANYADTVTDTPEDVEGVRPASANVATDDATVTYEPEANSLAAVSDAIDVADVTHNRDDPMDVREAIHVSHESLAKIKQNLFRALGHDTAMIPLASLGFPRP